jgi:hypothetical protein
MDSTTPPERPDRILLGIARSVAFELRLPWRVEQLRQEAAKAYETAERRAARSGLPPKQTDELIRRFIYAQVKKAGEGMEGLPPGEENPAPERIEAALRTFTAEQWKILVEGFGQADVEALLSFIQLDADRLKQRLGPKELGRIEERARLRENILWVENNRSTLVPISDPYWADVLREEARQENLERRGHPAKGVSVSEEASDRSLARLLSKRDEQTDREMRVSPYEIKRWRERAESLTYEQYLVDVGADDEEKRAVAFIDYHAMIRKRHQGKNSSRK